MNQESIYTHPKKRQSIEYQNPNPLNVSRQSIEKFVFEFMKENNYSYQDNLEELMEGFGGVIYNDSEFLFNHSESGSILVHGKNDFEVFLSPFTGRTRDRFTIAHEFGHFILHSNYGEIPIQASRFGSSQIEYEANYFAAAILMPQESIIEEFNKHPNEISLASKFDVSITAIKVRLSVLNLKSYHG